MVANVSEDHIGLNMALNDAQQEKGTVIKIKSASSKMVFYKVTSENRSVTKPNIELSLIHISEPTRPY